MLLFQLALLLPLAKCLDDGLFAPEDVYVRDPYCGPVIWNGSGIMFPTYKSCMIELLNTCNLSNYTTDKRELYSSVVSPEVFDYLDLYNMTESFFKDVLHL